MILNLIGVSCKWLVSENREFPYCYKRSCFFQSNFVFWRRLFPSCRCDCVCCDVYLLHVGEEVWIYSTLWGLNISFYHYLELVASSVFALVFGCMFTQVRGLWRFADTMSWRAWLLHRNLRAVLLMSPMQTWSCKLSSRITSLKQNYLIFEAKFETMVN